MPNEHNNQPHHNSPTENLSDAAILRLAADSEPLSPAHNARLAELLASDPTNENRIAFENALRNSCARTLNITNPAITCPQNIRDSILQQTAASSQQTQPAPLRLTHSDHATTPQHTHNGTTPNKHRFSLRTFMNLAAVIALVAAAALFLRTTLLPGSAQTEPGVALASFLAHEHTTCTTDFASRHDKFVITNPTDIPAVFRNVLNTSPSIPDMQALGLEFKGAGRCHVPGDGSSIHLLFAPSPEKQQELCETKDYTVSLFIQTDTGQFDIAPGETYVLKSPDIKGSVMAWKSDGLLHFLVTACPINCNRVSNALEAPQTRRDIEKIRCANRRKQ